MRTARQDDVIGRALRAGGVATAAACMVALIWGPRVSAGIGAGAATGLLGVVFFRRFVPWMLARRQPKLWLWIAWGIKLPVVLAGLYLAVVVLAVSPIGLCIGVAIVPGVFTADALRSLKACARSERDDWHSTPGC